MRTLHAVDVRGLVIPDHFPELEGDRDGMASLADASGCRRGLLGRA